MTFLKKPNNSQSISYDGNDAIILLFYSNAGIGALSALHIGDIITVLSIQSCEIIMPIDRKIVDES